jgi:predicted GIY-YIG superfamily endonuclease
LHTQICRLSGARLMLAVRRQLMDQRFTEIVESLHPSFERLMQMNPVTTSTLPRGMPKSGIYVFTERSHHLYVGRSNRLRSRIRRHGAEGSKHNVAAFAFKVARIETGNHRATYQSEGSRKHLVQQVEFARAFLEAKARIRAMEVRFVEETDQLRQAVLEIYIAIALGTPFNDFDTH